MLELNGFAAWISIDGEEVPEYGVETDSERNTVTCWIASENFSVCWKKLENYGGDILGRVEIDGTRCGGTILYANRPLGHQVEKKGVAVEDSSIRPFIFVALTADPEPLLDAPAPVEGSLVALQDLGVIQLRTIPVVVLDEQPRAGLSFPEPSAPSTTGLSERISLGAPVDSSYERNLAIREPGPALATFRFKYRPIDTLQASGIAPRPDRPHSIVSLLPLSDPEQRAVSDEEFEQQFFDLQTRMTAFEEQLRLRKAHSLVGNSTPASIVG
ncbi:hypothetical protein HMN09_00735900 [Mycena chlorophos]|uniref:DUF7918 domain-containing protein n=1 Tax=Mycena chlorophos TaxID=658473 RepID=A0A8H6SVE2_MYCCL|nr:hypothetical protein HMN09_00735900 [Mycena chlorophos]